MKMSQFIAKLQFVQNAIFIKTSKTRRFCQVCHHRQIPNNKIMA